MSLLVLHDDDGDEGGNEGQAGDGEHAEGDWRHAEALLAGDGHRGEEVTGSWCTVGQISGQHRDAVIDVKDLDTAAHIDGLATGQSRHGTLATGTRNVGTAAGAAVTCTNKSVKC